MSSQKKRAAQEGAGTSLRAKKMNHIAEDVNVSSDLPSCQCWCEISSHFKRFLVFQEVLAKVAQLTDEIKNEPEVAL